MNLLNLGVALLVSFIYVWALYSIPVLVIGLRNLRNSKGNKKVTSSSIDYPRISVIVPVKNEENVLGRLLSSILNTDYPKEKREIVVVEDGSVDSTLEICKDFEKKYPSQVKVITRNVSDGKPSALVEALDHVSGDVVGVFDADNVVEKDCFLRVADCLSDPSVVAVQGKIAAINAQENMLTQLIAHEETLRYEGFCRGKDSLGLFVPLMGSNYFVRKKLLERVGGWDASVLSEDMELAVRLIQNGEKVKYAPEVRSWQEYPSSIKSFFKQRIRWWRGAMEVGFKYGRLLRKPTRLSLDAELTLVGSFAFVSYMFGYLFAVLSLFLSFNPDFVTLFLSNLCTVFTVVLLGVGGIVMFVSTKPRKFRNLLYVPLMYFYWVMLNFVASFALLQMIFHRPKKWNKTEKHGVVANSEFPANSLVTTE